MRNTFAKERGEGCSELSEDAVTIAVWLEKSGQNSTSESHVVRKPIGRAIHVRVPRVVRGRLLQVLTEVATYLPEVDRFSETRLCRHMLSPIRFPGRERSFHRQNDRRAALDEAL